MPNSSLFSILLLFIPNSPFFNMRYYLASAGLFAALNIASITLAYPLVATISPIHDQSPNPLMSLSIRAVPANQDCQSAEEWVGRECYPLRGPRWWRDNCVNEEDGPYTGEEEQCPEGTTCFDTIDNDGHRNVHCIPNPTREDEDGGDRQSGIIDEAARAGVSNEYITSVKLDNTIEAGTVAAYVEGV
jgi:hypothetical protein